MQTLIAVLSAAVGLIGYVPYVRDLMRPTETKPDPILWGIWLLEYTALVFVQVQHGAGIEILLPGSQLVGVAIVLTLSLRRGAFTVTWQEMAWLAGVGVAMVLWLFANSAVMAILILIVVENSAVAGTIRKVWQKPRSENLIMWATASMAGIIGLLAIKPESEPITYAYPASLAIMTALVVAIATMQRRRDVSLAMQC